MRTLQIIMKLLRRWIKNNLTKKLSLTTRDFLFLNKIYLMSASHASFA